MGNKDIKKPVKRVDLENTNKIKKNKPSKEDLVKKIGEKTTENVKNKANENLLKKVEEKNKPSKENLVKKIEENTKKESESFKERENSKEQIYKHKISKNSIKLKNIEMLYPNNIGVKETQSSYLVLYKNKNTADRDLKKNEKEKFFRNKLVVSNFSYKEDEESIRKYMGKLGKVSEISLEKNKEGGFTGKAVVTFFTDVKISGELKLNNKILRVERIKKLDVNDKRIFIGRIDMNLSILQIRNAMKACGAKPTDIRIRFEKDTHKNIGYGHLTFKDREDALNFEKSFPEIKKVLGKHAFYEYAKEKPHKSKR
ncbi:Nuclear polyadenylated RNA-binding protein 4 [Nosema granulosis]|uniref:Nuclear polyadenylated RNA-binding protein 4 n=1 Tax=Nosema granulosis TaxID=83296 RepID=A0A9P6H184_9MICR|nr:Nuclear polyadenylated RNA-binding protein 4 [Nosema granulosis]